MTCYADPAVAGGHAIRNQHATDCTERLDCFGCLPCLRDDDSFPVRHCPLCRTARHQHLAPGREVCEACLAGIRSNLDIILECAAAMPEEAIERGIDSEAFAFVGPYAELTAWHQNSHAARQTYEAADLSEKTLEKLLDDGDPTDPRTVLGEWERQLRQLHGYDHLSTSTHLSGMVTYLKGALALLAMDRDHVDTIRALAGSVRETRGHLEAVLRNSQAPKTGAPCPACAEGIPGGDAAAVDADRHAPPLRLVEVDSDTSGASDYYQCPKDRDHWWSLAAYRLRISDDYRSNAVWLTARDLGEVLDVSASTVRTWASPDRVVPGSDKPLRKRTQGGRTVYDVAQARAMRDKREEAS